MTRDLTRSVAVIVATAAVGALLPLALLPRAGASHSRVVDPNDSRSALDVSRARMKGRSEPRWIVSTYETWGVAAMRDKGFLLVEYDTFGTSHFDYYALVRSNGDRLVGSLWRNHQRRPDRRLRTLRVSRPTLASMRVRVPLRALNFGDRVVYLWRITTLFTGARCRRVCIDHAPNSGGQSEPVPGAIPASPTPSFTLVPTTPPIPEPSEAP